jgi:hypothetical protein
LCSLVLTIGALGCTLDSSGNVFGAPMILPESARLGDTVAMIVANSEDRLNTPGTFNNFTFSRSRDNLRINLDGGSGPNDPNATGIVPRAVIEIPAWLGSAYARFNKDRVGQNLKVVLFDIPSTGGNFDTADLPFTVNVILIQENVYIGTGLYANIPYGFERELHVHAAGGSPIEFGVFSDPAQLEAQPMYRLAPSWTQGSRLGIDPVWRIASMEFTLRYATSVGITNPQAYAAGAATGALVVLGDVVSDAGENSVKIALVKPDGINPFGNTNLPCPTSNRCYSPAPMLDISFEKTNPPESVAIGDPVFVESTFTLADFKMYDVNGDLLENASGSNNPNNYFARAVIRNLKE